MSGCIQLDQHSHRVLDVVAAVTIMVYTRQQMRYITDRGKGKTLLLLTLMYAENVKAMILRRASTPKILVMPASSPLMICRPQQPAVPRYKQRAD